MGRAVSDIAQRPLTLEEQEALEDAADVEASRKAIEEMQRTGDKGRPWREVVTEMGLDPDDLGPDGDGET
jgi:hypothetical protein